MAISALIANTVEPLGGPNLGLSTEQGDSWGTAVAKINAQMTELYNRTGGTGTLTQGANFRNILDGGDFTVNPWQRGTSFTSIGTTLTYTADRWFMVAGATTSGVASKLANTAVPGFGSALSFGRATSAASVSAITVGQVLESADSVRAQGQVVNFSFWAQANTGYVTSSCPVLVQIIQGAGTDQSSSAAVNGTWTSQSNVVSASQTITTTMTRYSFSGTVTNTATQLGVLLGYTPSTTSAAANETIILHGAQLEIGAVTPFEHRDLEVELALCQRYFFQINEGTSGSIVGAGMINGTNSAYFVMQAPVQMRTAPTVSVVTTGSFAALIVGTPTSLTGMSAVSTQHPNYISVTGNVTAVSGQATMLFSRQPNSGVITASAEL